MVQINANSPNDVFSFEVDKKKQVAHQSWFRGENCNFNPSIANMRGADATVKNVLQGWLPDKPEIGPDGRPTGKIIKEWDPRILANPRLFYYATRINPYYVGFRMFRDIKERWDKYYEEGFREDEWGKKIPVEIDGDQKIREVMESEDDVWSLDEVSEIHFKKDGGISLYFNHLRAEVAFMWSELGDKIDGLKKVVEHLNKSGKIDTVTRINLNYEDGAVVSFRNS